MSVDVPDVPRRTSVDVICFNNNSFQHQVSTNVRNRLSPDRQKARGKRGSIIDECAGSAITRRRLATCLNHVEYNFRIGGKIQARASNGQQYPCPALYKFWKIATG